MGDGWAPAAAKALSSASVMDVVTVTKVGKGTSVRYISASMANPSVVVPRALNVHVILPGQGIIVITSCASTGHQTASTQFVPVTVVGQGRTVTTLSANMGLRTTIIVHAILGMPAYTVMVYTLFDVCLTKHVYSSLRMYVKRILIYTCIVQLNLLHVRVTTVLQTTFLT